MLFVFLTLAHHELMLFATVGLALGSIDDFLIDIVYGLRRAWRSTVIHTRFPRMTMADLPPSTHPGTLAIFIPAWKEAT